MSPKLGTSGVHDGAAVGALDAVGVSVGAWVGSLVAGIKVGSLVAGSEVVGDWLVGDDVAGADETGDVVGAEETGALVKQSPSHESMLQKLNAQSDAMFCHTVVSVPSAVLSM